jgi:hypothetical protein
MIGQPTGGLGGHDDVTGVVELVQMCDVSPLTIHENDLEL